MGVRRRGRWLLRPVTFGVAEGVIGLAGPPGAGKSTLLATLATLRRPNNGALHILGHDTANASDLRAARARIGYLPGRLSRAENMTAGEFVAYAAYYKRTSASAARDMVRRLDLTEAAGTELSLLPPDVRLRAGLAAACVHAPDMVLLDDPFGELCAAAEPWPTGATGPGARTHAAAMAELIPVVRSLAPTVVVTADAAETLTGWCDRLLTLARGKLTEIPTHSATARRGRTATDRRRPPTPSANRTTSTPATTRTPPAPNADRTSSTPGAGRTSSPPSANRTPPAPTRGRAPSAPTRGRASSTLDATQTPSAPGLGRAPAGFGASRAPSTPSAGRTSPALTQGMAPSTPDASQTPPALDASRTSSTSDAERASSPRSANRTPPAPTGGRAPSTPDAPQTPSAPGAGRAPAGFSASRAPSTPGGGRTPPTPTRGMAPSGPGAGQVPS
ncbi:ATP-binding cassette domain-containing protein, partial [Actinomadura rubrisoli]|uniref:ATP-binding cassette domain-containing protein n=1 Tax=Actinomadura rubrisoli TaxID=2530368 RepID=UPI001FB6BF40